MNDKSSVSGSENFELLSGIRQQVEAGNEGKIVVIDIETGDFEVDETVMAATDWLFERQPDAQPWTLRIRHSAVYHFGSSYSMCKTSWHMEYPLF